MKLFLCAVILPFTQHKQCDKNTTALRQHRSYYTTDSKSFWWDIFSFWYLYCSRKSSAKSCEIVGQVNNKDFRNSLVPLCILSSPSRCVRQENGHKTAIQGLRKAWKSGGGGGGRGQEEIQSLLNEKVLLLFLQNSIPTALQREICHRLLSYLVTRKERQKKLGNRKKKTRQFLF